ncbi:adenosine receptor A1-like [Stylophora pistillata]|uniref:adenosine receptor A1-like n=1 Tax=Stylophora pistillata TaxID=50429 RepID=UPI000C03B898|nr:adenosine receptor A1-like [Stylophora pistillata]
MPNLTTAILFFVINAIQALTILAGNAFAMHVFCARRRCLKRTAFLLINLAVTDFLIGAATLVEIIYHVSQEETMKGIVYDEPISAIQISFSSSSLFCLVGISLERVYAVLWPYRHRALSKKFYIVNIALAWVAGITIGIIYAMGELEVFRKEFGIATEVVLLCSLAVFVVSYAAIRTRMNKTVPSLNAHNRHTEEQNIKLSHTLFIVKALSLLLWVPAIVLYGIQVICNACAVAIAKLPIVSSARVLHLSNSIVNPVVYSYRMPMFREEIKKCLEKVRCYKSDNSSQSGQLECFDTRL